MKRSIGRVVRIAAGAALMICCMQAVAAQWALTYPRPLSDNDMRDEYPIALLTLALEKTGVKYSLLPSDRIMLQGKALRQLKENREVNVVWSMTDTQREKELLPIRIPIAKGLIGWRVFLINKQKRRKFSAVNSRQSLLSLSPIQGEEWPDTKILQANGFNVLTVSDYPEGISILEANRGDFFPRSVIEITNEANDENTDPDIMIEPGLALYYPTAMYFFVNKGNTTLARLIETGLKRAVEDGSFDALFMATHEEMLKGLALEKRTTYLLENPLLPEGTPLSDDRLWFRPQQLGVDVIQPPNLIER